MSADSPAAQVEYWIGEVERARIELRYCAAQLEGAIKTLTEQEPARKVEPLPFRSAHRCPAEVDKPPT